MKRAIYDFFSNEIDSNGDYYNIGTFEEFEKDMQNPDARKEFYDFFSNEVDENGDYYNLGTFAEFEQDIARSTAKEIGKASAQATGQATKEQPQVARPVTAVQASDRGPFYTTKAFGDWLNGQPNPQMVEQTKAINQAQSSGQVTETPTAPSAPKAEDITTTKATATTAEAPKVETTATPVSALRKADGTPYKAEELQATADKQQGSAVAEQPTVQVESVDESLVTPTETDQAKLEAKATKAEGDQKAEDGDESWNEYKAKLKDLYGGMNIPEASQVDNSIGIKFTEEAPYNRYAGQYIEYAERMVLQKLHEIAIEQNGGQPLSDAQMIAITNQAKSMSEKDVQKVLGAEGLEALRKFKERTILWEKQDQRNAHAINNLLTDPSIANYLKQFYDGESLAEVAQNAVKDSEVELGQMNADDAKKYIGARMAYVDYLLGDDAMQYYLRNINNNEQTKQNKAQAILSTAVTIRDLLYGGIGLPEKAKTYARNALKTAVKNGQIGTTDGNAVVNDVLNRLQTYPQLFGQLSEDAKKVVLNRLNYVLPTAKITSLEDAMWGDTTIYNALVGEITKYFQQLGAVEDFDSKRSEAEEKYKEMIEDAGSTFQGNPYAPGWVNVKNWADHTVDQIPDAREWSVAIDMNDDTADILNNSAKSGFGGFFQGLADGTFDLSTWDFGFSDTQKNLAIKNVLTKLDNDEPLTEGETALADAIVSNLAAQALVSPSMAYKVGNGVAVSIPYLLEMTLPVFGVGKGVARKLYSFALKREAKGALKKIAKTISKVIGTGVESVERTVLFGGGEIGAKVIEKTTGKADIKRDENGELKVVGTKEGTKESPGKAITKSILSQATTYFVERVGGNIFSVANIPFAKGKDFVMNKVGVEFTPNEIWDGFVKRTGWQGTPSEFFEEILDQVAQATIEGEGFDKIATVDNLLTTAYTTLALGTMLKAPNAIGYKSETKRLETQIEDLSTMGEVALGKEWEGIQSRIDNATFGEIQGVLSDIAKDKKLTPEQKRIAINYGLNVGVNKEIIDRQEKGQLYDKDNESIKAQETIINAMEQGANITDVNEGYNSQIRENMTGESLARMVGVESISEAKDVIAQRYGTNSPMEIAIEVANDASLNDTQRKVILDYYTALATNQGKQTALEQKRDINKQTAEAVSAKINKDMGKQVVTATRKVDGAQVTIIAGNIVTNEEGAINKEKSDDAIVSVDADGNKEMISLGNISSIATQSKEDAELEERAKLTQELEKAENVSNGRVSVGDVIDYGFYDGNTNAKSRKVVVTDVTTDADGNRMVTFVEQELNGAEPVTMTEKELEVGRDIAYKANNGYQIYNGPVGLSNRTEQATQAEPTQEQAPSTQVTEVVEESTEQPTAIEPGAMVSLADGSIGEVVSMPEDGRVIVEHEDGSTNEYNVGDLKVAEKPSAQTSQAPQAPTAPQVESTANATSEGSGQEILDNSNEEEVLGEVFNKFTTQKGDVVEQRTKTKVRGGIRHTTIHSTRNGKEVSVGNSYFPIPDGLEATYIPEGVEVLGVHEIREDVNTGAKSGTIVVRYEDGGLGKIESPLVMTQQREAETPTESAQQVEGGSQENTNEANGPLMEDDVDIIAQYGSIVAKKNQAGDEWAKGGFERGIKAERQFDSAMDAEFDFLYKLNPEQLKQLQSHYGKGYSKFLDDMVDSKAQYSLRQNDSKQVNAIENGELKVENEATPTSLEPQSVEIPTNEKGQPMYEEVSAEETIADLTTNKKLDAEEVAEYVQARIDGANKRIADLQANKPKVGEDLNDYTTKRDAWRAEMTEQQKQLDYWNGVKSALSKPSKPTATATPRVATPSTPSPKMDTPKAEPTAPPMESKPKAKPIKVGTKRNAKGQVIGLIDSPLAQVLNNTTRRTLNKLGEALGVSIHIVPHLEGANAKIEGNRITIAIDAEQGPLKALGHELLHRIKSLSPKAYEDFADVVEKIVPSFQARMVATRLVYSNAGRKIDMKLLREEVVADLAGDVMYHAGLMQKFVEVLRPKNTKEIIMDTMRDLYARIRGVFEGEGARNFAKAERVLLDAMKKANKVQSNEKEERKEEKEKYSLIGERGASALDQAEEATIRMDNLAKARKMERFDYPTKSIRMATGWERGADGKWRYEIDDVKLKKTTYENTETTLGELVDNAELFSAYPSLMDLKVVFTDTPNNTLGRTYSQYAEDENGQGAWIPTQISLNNLLVWDDAETESVLAHEIQHAIQSIEGFVNGGDSANKENYHRLAGEVEARNVQSRMGMTPDQRRATLLAETEDVAREDQIFLMENSGVSAMGSTVVKRKADIAVKLQGKDISPTQLKVVDAFTTDVNNIAIDVVDANGKQRNITLKQGQDNRAGVKHSVLKHYETASNSYSAEDILLIPQIIEQGERKQDGKKVSYKLGINGVTYSVTTEINNRGAEVFTNFYTNRSGNARSSNTQLSAQADSTTTSASKGSDNIGDVQGLEGYSAEEIKEIAREYIEDVIAESGFDAEVVDLAIYGSRRRGDARDDSDLDIVVEYSGNVSEDGLFNALNDAETQLEINGVKVDINPITKGKSGSLNEFMKRAEEYDNDTKYSLRSNSQEVADIVAKAKADGTYMKAPNGEPTNLTEEQWANVRTKAFKDWFGDWENDSENASKVVDENGEPMVVYHGTESDFNVFDRTKGRASMDIQGMFFSPWELDAQGYGRNVRAFYLNIRKPSSGGQSYKALNRYQGQMYAGVKARDYLIGLGYDGVDNYGEEFIAFEPNQIKSATDNVGTYSSEDNDIRYSLRGNTPFYSNAEYAVENIKQGKATPEQWLAMIQKNGGLKAGEDKWLGLSDWLNEKGKRKDERGKSVTLTKEEVLEFINQNKIKIEEVGYSQFGEGFIDEATKKLEAELKEVGWDEMENRYPGFGEYFEMYGNELVWSEEKAGIGEYEDFILDNKILTPDAQDNAINETRERYTTEGLENKKEIALVVPSVDPYNAHDEIHFGDAGGGRAVAWVRFGETTDENGNRVLVIDEIQSKRHQDGRERGYQPKDIDGYLADNNIELVETDSHYEFYKNGELDRRFSKAILKNQEDAKKLYVGGYAQTLVPDAPFEKNWQELAMKRMLRYAAENGFDKVAWTTGAQQAERYSMGRLFNDIEREDNPNLEGRRFVLSGANAETFQVDDNGNITASTISEAEGKSLQEVVGKEMAIKMMNLEDGDLIENEDLRIGGEGMKGFYDKMLPSFMNKYGKKWGVKVGEVTMPELQEGYQTMHSIDVTDAMRESVMEGQPMFRDGSGVLSDTDLSYANDPFAKALGKSQRSKAKQAKFAERERKYMRNRVAELVEKLGIGERVELIEGGEFDNERKARAKGWYDAKSGKIVINLANHTSVADIERTLLHEAVSHHGLRELFGKQFNTFLDNVFRSADYNIRTQIVGLATRNGWDFRTATEEYLAQLAEDTNFDALENNWSFWSKIKQLFMDMLESIGWNYQGPTLTDNELRYLLWRSYENMVNPGRHRSILGMAEDATKREKFGIGTYRTDEDIESQVAEGEDVKYSLRGSADNKRDIGEKMVKNVILNDIEGKPLPNDRKSAFEYIPEGGIVYKNDAEEVNIKVSRKSVKHTALHKKDDTYAIFGGIGEVIKEAIKIGEMPVAQDEIGKTNSVGVYYVPVNINGTQYSARLLVKELINNDIVLDDLSLYHVGLHKEKGSQYKPLNASNEVGGVTAKPISKYKVKDLIYNSQEQDKKILGITGDTKFSLRVGGVLHPDSDGTREEYDKRVKTTSKKFEKSAMTFYNFIEAFVDEMRSLDILQRIVEKKYGIKLPSFENALDAENRSSSMALKEFEAFMDGEYDAMMQFVDRWIKSGETTQSINYYMIAKSGLERNREFTVRDAINELLNHEDESKRITKAQAEQMRKNYADERNALLVELKSGNIDFVTFNKFADKLARKYAFGHKIEDYSGLTGITGDENNFRQIAEDMVLEFEAKHGDAVVDFWNAVKDVTKAPVRKSYESGLLSKSMYDKLTTMFEWYIPMRGFEKQTAEDVYSYIGADTGVFNPTVALAKGHTEVSDDPLAIMGNMMQSAILQGNRNAVKQRLLFMARNHPVDVLTESRVWLVLHPDGTWVSSYPELSNDMSADQVAQAIAEHEAKMEKLAKDKKAKISNVNLDVDFKIEKASNKSAHAIDVMLNGNHYVIYVNGNPRVAQAVNGQLKDKGTNWLYEVWRSYARWYTASKTSLDVNFMFPNVGRDIQHSTLMTIMDKGFIQGLKFFFNGFATIIPVIKGVSGAQIKGPKMRKYWEEFVKYGGETGYAHLESVDDFKRKNEKRLKRMKGVKKATTIAKGTFKYIGSAFDYANRIAESSTRFNAYVSSRKSGADIYDAIRYAKDITVNFNRKGSSMTPGIFGAAANAYRFWMPFANPIIQGIYQFLKVGRRNKGRFFTICGVQMALGFVIPMVNEILFEAIGGDDEDKYINQPDHARRTNMMFYIGGKYIKIPLPPIFRELYGLGDIAYSTMKGLYSPKEATMETVGQIRSMFSLQGQSSMKGKEFSIERFILPGHLAWIADIEENTTFTGQPLYKEGDFIDEQTPEYQKVYNGTWRYLVEWSRELNHFLGGTDDKAVELPLGIPSRWMNPAVWQHVISEFGGGPYKFVMDIADLVSPESNDEGEPAEFTWSKVPVAKRFVAEVGDRAETRLLNKQYYDYIDSFDDIEYEEKVYTKKAKMGSMEYAEKLNELILSPEYREYKVKNGYEKAVKDLNKYLNDPGLDKSDRKQVEDAIERFKREILTEAPKVKNFPADGASEKVKEKLDSIKDVVEDVIGDGNEQTKERNRVIRDAKSNLEPLDMEAWKEEQKDKVK